MPFDYNPTVWIALDCFGIAAAAFGVCVYKRGCMRVFHWGMMTFWTFWLCVNISEILGK